MSENVSANIDAMQAAPTRRRRGLFIALGLAVAAAAIGGYFCFSKTDLPPRQFVESTKPYTPNLHRPDALTESVSLSRLPKICLACPCCATP